MTSRIGEFLEGRRIKKTFWRNGVPDSVDAFVTSLDAEEETYLVVEDCHTGGRREMQVSDVMAFGHDWKLGENFEKLRLLVGTVSEIQVEATAIAQGVMTSGDDIDPDVVSELNNLIEVLTDAVNQTKHVRRRAFYLHPENVDRHP